MRGLVNGLQNRVHPFESGTDLKLTVEAYLSSKMCFFVFMPESTTLFWGQWKNTGDK